MIRKHLVHGCIRLWGSENVSERNSFTLLEIPSHLQLKTTRSFIIFLAEDNRETPLNLKLKTTGNPIAFLAEYNNEPHRIYS